jgi:hypothetical protein
MKKLIYTILFLLSSILAVGQGVMYSYTDPCTAKTKQIYFDTSNGSIPLTYNGQIRAFTESELQSGAFQDWIELVNSQNPEGPCSGVGLTQNTTMNVLIAQNNISVVTSVLSVLSDISTINGGSTILGIVETDEKVSSNNNNNNKEEKKDNKNETNNGTNSSGTNRNNNTDKKTSNTNGNSDTNSGNGTSTGNERNADSTSPNTTTTGNQETQTPLNNVTGSVNSVRLDNTEKSETSEKNKEGVDNALTSSSQASSNTKSKVANTKKGNLMMNGDVVVIGSADGADPSQFKMNASIISSNTKNTFAKGVLINFTSYINNSNITLFVSYRRKNFTSILANSTMINFDKDFFNTISLMESYKYRKVTSTVGVNLTTGNLGVSKFKSLSILGGVYSDFKINKKIKLTTMFVGVYSPYVYYYQGMWYNSGFLAIPFISGDYKITKKFKLNISVSGVQQINDKPLSYQILTGAKAVL